MKAFFSRLHYFAVLFLLGLCLLAVTGEGIYYVVTNHTSRTYFYPQWSLALLSGGLIFLVPFLYVLSFWLNKTRRIWIQAYCVLFYLAVFAVDFHNFTRLASSIGFDELIRRLSFAPELYFRFPWYFYSTVGARFFVALAGLVTFWAVFRASTIPAPAGPRGLRSVSISVVRAFALQALVFTISASVLGHAFVRFTVEGSSAGYLSIRSTGIFSKVTTFSKGSRQVVVYPTIHVAEKEFYDSLTKRFDDQDGVTLLEGVRMKKIEKGMNYRKIASALGVAHQGDDFLDDCSKGDRRSHSQFQCKGRMVYFYADINFEELLPRTQELVKKLAKSSTGQNIVDGFVGNYTGTGQLDNRLIVDEMMNRREERLFSAFSNVEEHYKLFVMPWGAAHAHGIAKRLKGMGYEATEQEFVKVLDMSSMLRPVLGGRPSYKPSYGETNDYYATKLSLKEI